MLNKSQASGIDVSHYQGTVNWQMVKDSGVSFAFAKATQGVSFIDSKFQTNWQGMKNADLLRGAYHFFEADNDPVKQADHFIKVVGTLNVNDLPPVLDVETTENASSSVIQQGVQTWLDRVKEKLGRVPLVYTTASFWNTNKIKLNGEFPLWVAHYGVSTPKIPTEWEAWNFWQYSQTGSVSGVTGNVDLNWFNGTYLQLLNFIRQNR